MESRLLGFRASCNLLFYKTGRSFGVIGWAEPGDDDEGFDFMGGNTIQGPSERFHLACVLLRGAKPVVQSELIATRFDLLHKLVQFFDFDGIHAPIHIDMVNDSALSQPCF